MDVNYYDMFGFTFKGVIMPKKRLLSKKAIAHINLTEEAIGTYYIFGAPGILHYKDAEGDHRLNVEMGDWLVYIKKRKVIIVNNTDHKVYMKTNE
jgi:hypothetical protein